MANKKNIKIQTFKAKKILRWTERYSAAKMVAADNGTLLRRGRSFVPKSKGYTATRGLSLRSGIPVEDLQENPDGTVTVLCYLSGQQIADTRKKGLTVNVVGDAEICFTKGRQGLPILLEWSDGKKIYQLNLKVRDGAQMSGKKVAMQKFYLASVTFTKLVGEMIEKMPDDGDDGSNSGLFQSFVDPGKLASSFWEIFVKFFGIEPEARLTGRSKTIVDFAAYLFLLVEHEGLGSQTFGIKGRKPFFEFVRDRVIPALTMTPRTFNNYIKAMDGFRKMLEQEPKGSDFRQARWNNTPHIGNYRTISDYFHNTPYYEELKPYLQ